MVVVHSSLPPSDAEWSSYIAEWEANIARHSEMQKLRTLVSTDGGAPNAAQRAKLTQAMRGKETPVAILLDGILARAAVTALSLFIPELKAFPPSAVDQAMNFLGLAAAERRAALELLKRLGALSGARTVRQVSSSHVA
jgi:hypothetical protein